MENLSLAPGAMLLQRILENSLAPGAMLLQSVLENLSLASQRALENLSFAPGALLLQSALENLSLAPSKRHLCWPEQIYQLPCRCGWPCLSRHCPTFSLSSPSKRWHTCPHCVLASSTSTHWCCCPSCAGFCSIAKLLGTCCCCRAGPFHGMSCCPRLHCVGTVPALHWRRRPPRTGVIAPSRWCHSSSCTGFCPLAMLSLQALAPLLHCNGVIALVALASLFSPLAPPPASCWCLFPCAGILALVALVSAHSRHCNTLLLPSWHPCRHCAGILGSLRCCPCWCRMA